MSESALPPPERCAHNLHRAADRISDEPEPTDLCTTDLGVVHMLDCPLFLGRRCAWFAEAAERHPTTSDAEIAAARETLQRDFLGWRYRQRVRSLSRPRDLLAHRIAIEVAPGPPEEEEPLVLRVPVAAPGTADAVSEGEPAPVGEPVAGEAAADGVLAEAHARAPAAAVNGTPSAEVAPDAPVEPAPAPAVEMYPGQRRSEDRGRKKAKRQQGAARPAWRLPAETAPAAATSDEPGPSADGGADDFDDAEGDDTGDDFGDGLAVAETPAAPPAPRTLDELLDVTPEATLPPATDGRERGRGGGPGDGRGPHRRRRRGGGGGGPRGPGGPGPQRPPQQGGGPDRGPRPGGFPGQGGGEGRRRRRRGGHGRPGGGPAGPRGPSGPPPGPPSA